MKALPRCLGQSLALIVVAGLPAYGAPPVDVILEWNAVALEANVIDHNGPAGNGEDLSGSQGPPASARVLGIVHAAMFDAYNSIDRRFEPYLIEVENAQGASIDAAVAQAAHDVLAALIPAGADLYDARLLQTLRRVRSRPQKLKGIAVGKEVAEFILALRSSDVVDPSDLPDYVPTGEPGNHDVDPNNPGQGFFSPGFGAVPPFGVPDVTVFRAPTPPALDTMEYADAFNEVKSLGVFRGGNTGTVAPTDDETYVIANYWSYNGSVGTGTPPRLYNQIARVIAKQKGNKVHENARLFALLNIAMADAGISAWDTKYFYAYWRPILAIRNADLDDNPNTEIDAMWSPLGASRSNPFPGEMNFTPPFPAYTSGHATFGAAAFKTLANFYQTDLIPFVFISDEWNGRTVDQFGRRRPIVPRFFPTLSQAAAENAASRVFNGVHWRFDGTEGVRAGNGIANAIFENLLQPKSGPFPPSIPDADFEAQIDEILTSFQN